MRLRVALAVVVMIVALLAGYAWWLRSHAVPPSSFDYIADQAQALGSDVKRIVAFVRTDVHSDTYEGVLRGPLGTLWARTGNDLDRALLLQALLSKAGVTSRLMYGQTYGVEIVEAGSTRYVGPARDADPAASPLTSVAADQYHMVDARIRTTPPGASAVEEGLKVRAADLVGSDLRLSYRRQGGTTVAVLAAGSQELATTVDAATALRQDVIFRTTGPGLAPTERRRELFTREFADAPSAFHPDNRYAVVISTGWIPDSVRVREAALAQAWSDRTDALHHLIAYTFLARSDEAARTFMTEKRVTARMASPRITIVGTEAGAVSGRPMRSVTIDLRKNDVAVDGTEETRVAFATARSLYDASLESEVVSRLTGQRAISAVALIADAFARRQSSLAERQALLAGALRRLLEEGREGANLGVAPEEKPEYNITFVRQADGLKAVPSEAITRALANSKPQDRWVLATPVIGSGEVDRAVQETEVALAVAGKLPINYRQAFTYSEVPERRFYANSRRFSFGGPNRELTFEVQFLALRPDLKVEIVDYYDDVAGQFNDPPSRKTVTITQDELQHAKVYTQWYSNDPGRTIDMISRDAYAELVRTGTTTLQSRNRDRSLTEPIQFWLVRRTTRKMTINNRTVDVPVLLLGGDFVSARATKPAKMEDLPDRFETGTRQRINKFTVLDDPDFPLILKRAVVQSAIPGQIVDGVTRRGVGNATVNIAEINVAAITWPDGRFAIPIIKEPFRKFQITVQAPGYVPLTITRDFRQANAFPLDFTLEPLPREAGFAWVEQSALSGELPALKLVDRSRRLIAEAIAADPDVAALVPTFDIYYSYGKTDAWLEINTRTYEIYGRLADGLYGATERLLPTPYATQHAGIAYYSGRVAAWYLFAAGAIDAVNLAMSEPSTTIGEMHKHAIKTAREMAKIYEGAVVNIAVGWGSAPPIVGSKVTSGAFRKGLRDGLDWAEEFYRKAWVQ